ncbi:hypothetical protein K440DRAFT_151233 [Wilcoxina mikolae CBS 423.85]|nr:hypothetical protein K440DRAFT_151233 [Wilcoxina mikolae CBS 423.85]
MPICLGLQLGGLQLQADHSGESLVNGFCSQRYWQYNFLKPPSLHGVVSRCEAIICEYLSTRADEPAKHSLRCGLSFVSLLLPPLVNQVQPTKRSPTLRVYMYRSRVIVRISPWCDDLEQNRIFQTLGLLAGHVSLDIEYLHTQHHNTNLDKGNQPHFSTQ